MATINSTYLSLADVMKRKDNDKDKKIAKIIEMLAQYNTMIQDAPVMECNNGTKHRTTMRTELPSVAWRKLNEGVAESKSGTTQVDDTTGILEAWSRVDAKLLEMSADPAGVRMSESGAFLQAMNNEAETALFYHNTNTDPEKILGLAPRYADLSAANGNNIIAAGGSGSDNTSMWFITWDEQATHLIYPEGTSGGLSHEDLGRDTVLDANNNPYLAYRDKYEWDLGLTVRDWRANVRIANIDVSDLAVDASTGANLFEQMVNAYWKLQNAGIPSGKKCIYANGTILKFLDHHTRNASSNIQLSWREYGPDSKPVLHFRDMPIQRSDAILETEATVS